jgi:hypothetical protein
MRRQTTNIEAEHSADLIPAFNNPVKARLTEALADLVKSDPTMLMLKPMIMGATRQATETEIITIMQGIKKLCDYVITGEK